jgi:hypothetical protein
MTWQAVKEEKPKVAGPEQKPQQRNQLGTSELPKNLPQPEAKETATRKEKTKPVLREPQGGDGVALVKQARDQGRYDLAVKLLNSAVWKGDPEIGRVGNRLVTAL